MELTKEQMEHLGQTNRVEVVQSPEGVKELIYRYCPEMQEDLEGVALVEIRDSGFKACDRDWDEIRFYESDRTLCWVHVEQRN